MDEQYLHSSKCYLPHKGSCTHSIHMPPLPETSGNIQAIHLKEPQLFAPKPNFGFDFALHLSSVLMLRKCRTTRCWTPSQTDAKVQMAQCNANDDG